jgi:branched-chain amino acid transport system substrate-binding protein
MIRLRFSFVTVLLALAMLLSACGGAQPTATPQANTGGSTTTTPATGTGATASAETPTEATSAGAAKSPAPKGPDPDTLVRIGFAFVTTGPNGIYGVSQRKATELAWHEIEAAGGINGHRIAATFQDTAGKPDKAISVFQGFTKIDNVLAIVGPTLSNEAKSSDPEAQKAGVPVLGVSSTDAGITDIGDFVFRDSLAESQVIPETIKQAKDKLKIGKVSILYAKDDMESKSGYDAFKAELQKNNIKILSEQTFAAADTDYKTQLAAIKADNPDAIVVSAMLVPTQTVTILQQARTNAGIDPKVTIIGNNSFNLPAVIEKAGKAAEGLVVGAAWNNSVADDLSQKFIANYKKTYGIDPDQFAAQSYAGFYILADAIKRANIKDYSAKSLKENRVAVRDALRATKDFPTVLGSFSFTDKRDANYPPIVQVVKNGKFEILK